MLDKPCVVPPLCKFEYESSIGGASKLVVTELDVAACEFGILLPAHDHVHGLRVDEHLARGLVVAHVQAVVIDAHDPLKVHAGKRSVRRALRRICRALCVARSLQRDIVERLRVVGASVAVVDLHPRPDVLALCPCGLGGLPLAAGLRGVAGGQVVLLGHGRHAHAVCTCIAPDPAPLVGGHRIAVRLREIDVLADVAAHGLAVVCGKAGAAVVGILDVQVAGLAVRTVGSGDVLAILPRRSDRLPVLAGQFRRRLRQAETVNPSSSFTVDLISSAIFIPSPWMSLLWVTSSQHSSIP